MSKDNKEEREGFNKKFLLGFAALNVLIVSVFVAQNPRIRGIDLGFGDVAGSKGAAAGAFGHGGISDVRLRELLQRVFPNASNADLDRWLSLLTGDPIKRARWEDCLRRKTLEACAEEFKTSGDYALLFSSTPDKPDPRQESAKPEDLVKAGDLPVQTGVGAPPPLQQKPLVSAGGLGGATGSALSGGGASAPQANSGGGAAGAGAPGINSASRQTGDAVFAVYSACGSGATGQCPTALAGCQANAGCNNWLRTSQAGMGFLGAGRTGALGGPGASSPGFTTAPGGSSPTGGGTTTPITGGGTSGGGAGAGSGGSSGQAPSPTPSPAPSGGGGGQAPSPTPSPAPSPAPKPSGGGGCFVAETRVSTPEGPRPIKDLAPGDVVWSMNPKTGALVPAKILRTFGFVSAELQQVTLSNGGSLRSTATHYFFDPKLGGFKPLKKFSVGDKLLALDEAPPQTAARAGGKPGPARAVEVTILGKKDLSTLRVPVYNLSLDGDEHNFLAEGVLVHNVFVAGTMDSEAVTHKFVTDLPEEP